MKKQKPERGEYGYLKQRKNNALLGTICMVLLGVSIFAVGLLLNKMETANLFTVVAVCMVIPAAKYLVGYVVLFPYKPMSRETMERLCSYAREGDTVLYDVVFTSAEKVMHQDCFYVTGHQIIGFSSRVKDSAVEIQEYLKKELDIRGLNYTVYLATTEKQITDRMKLRGEETEENEAARREVLEMLRVFTV